MTPTALTFVKLKVEQAIENRTIIQDFREHLGASVIGHQCRRKIWYGFFWVKRIEVEPRMLRLWNRGHREEPIVIQDLKEIGVTVLSTQEQKKFCYGHGGGSNDGILIGIPDAPKTPHILEVKTSNTKGFTNMKLKGVEKANPTHYAQMQVYMHIFKKKRALYIMVCKETDERYYERVKYNKKEALALLKKAEDIVRSELPPNRINEDEKYYLCNWCDYSDICHRGALPLRNCRTCINSILEDEGIWKCGLNRKKLKYKKQLKGCSKWHTKKVA